MSAWGHPAGCSRWLRSAYESRHCVRSSRWPESGYLMSIRAPSRSDMTQSRTPIFAA